jgi:transcriptional repressor of cell division inhibition gene dicB
MRTEAAIAHYVTAASLARALSTISKISQAAISQWGEFPPDRRQLQLERLTNGALKAEPGCEERVLGCAVINTPTYHGPDRRASNQPAGGRRAAGAARA